MTEQSQLITLRNYQNDSVKEIRRKLKLPTCRKWLKFMIGYILKLKDNKFEGKHPNLINTDYHIIGDIINGPIVGERCMVGSLSTSPVTAIINSDDDKVKFKTLNSVYIIHYLHPEKVSKLITKSNSYDNIISLMNKFYDEDDPEYDDDADLSTIGEAVAVKLGYL